MTTATQMTQTPRQIEYVVFRNGIAQLVTGDIRSATSTARRMSAPFVTIEISRKYITLPQVRRDHYPHTSWRWIKTQGYAQPERFIYRKLAA